ncbi:phage tail tape measure protein [Oceanobacter kriegii]|uniref:phage tail tape measure protein n=1 Tax=Oceanobacter kriegii TaxID=64972 RepID=UPI0004099244|nr:phage tail tape measure protein [Oceanobacter kriegii]
MARDLRLQVILDTIDKASAPLKSIHKQSGKATAALKEARDTHKQLNKQLKTAAGLQQMQSDLADVTSSLKENQAAIDANRTAHEEQLATHKEMASELRATEKRYKELSQSIIRGDDVSQQYRDELERTRTELNLLQKQTDKSSAKLKKYRDTISKGEGKVTALNQRQKLLNNSIGESRSKLTAAGISTDNLADSTADLRRKFDASTAAIEKQKAALAALNEREKALAKARQARKAMHTAGMKIAGHGAVMAYAGQQALTGIAGTLMPGIDYDAQKSAVQAITRLQANDPRLQALHNQSADLGASTSFTSTQVAQGQEFLARAGYSPEAIKASMKDVLDLAKANRIELAQAADIASNISGAFRIDAEAAGSMQRVSDILTATTTRANVDMQMLGETMKYLGQASGLDMSLEQAAAMAGFLGNIGIQGSEAGTTMRAMMTRLSAPTGAAQTALQELDVQVADTAGNLRQIPDILADINKATAGMGNVAVASYLKDIFGEEPGSGVSLLIEKQGKAALDKFADTLKNVKGENAKIAAIMGDNIQGDLDGLQSAIQSVSNEITGANDGPLRELVQMVTENVRAVSAWIKENPELTRQILKGAIAFAGIAAAAGALATVIGFVTIVASKLIMPIRGLTKGLWATLRGMWAFGKYLLMLGGKTIPYIIAMVKSLGSVLAWIAKGAISVLIGALKFLGQAILWVGRIVLANPITAAVTAIAVAAYLIYEHWDTVGPYFIKLWEFLKNVFLEALQAIKTLINTYSPIGVLYNIIKASLNKIGIELPGTFTEFGANLMQGLIKGIKSLLPDVSATIGDVAGNVSGWFKEKLGIHSPSRVFASHGNGVMAGLEQGLNDNADKALSPVDKLQRNLTAIGAGLAISTTAIGPVAAVEPSAGPHLTGNTASAISVQIGDIHIHPTPGMDERQLAAMVRSEIERLTREQLMRQRTRMRDTE